MHRFIRRALVAYVLLIAFIMSPAVTSARDWATTAARVEKSLVRITHPIIMIDVDTGKILKGTSVCTGFSIDEGTGYFFTAYHCLNKGTANGLLIDKEPARLLYANMELDLAVITGPTHKPALRVSDRVLRKGDQIATLGHGYGFNETLFRAGYVAHPGVDLSGEFGRPYIGLWVILDAPYIGGMSGGPVFDLDGRVVGVVQQADGYSGFGLNMDTILESTGFYWKH